eukprot:TRINITY_DN4807_c0_g1_i2.p1 TRINITY_DN4807_c0_g1~~TRINITY_DN4807_c0_g1_i2.p1  ORF type:complete len:1373 (-),score=282.44 TRINITY_DN4807_c0_g1_i2:58-3576(-)
MSLLLSDEIHAGDLIQFKLQAKEFVSVLEQWSSEFEGLECEASKQSKIRQDVKDIQDGCKSMISLSTVVFSGANEPSIKNDYDQIKDNVIKKIQDLLIFVVEATKSPRKSPVSDTISERDEDDDCLSESSPRIAKSPRVRGEGSVGRKHSSKPKKQSLGRAHSKKGLLADLDYSEPSATSSPTPRLTRSEAISEAKSSKEEKRTDSDLPSARSRPNFSRVDRGLQAVPEGAEGQGRKKKIQRVYADNVIKALKAHDPDFAALYDSKSPIEQQGIQKVITEELHAFTHELLPSSLANSSSSGNLLQTAASVSGKKLKRHTSIPDQDKPDKPDKPEKSEKPEKQEKPEKLEKSDKSDKSDRSEGSSRNTPEMVFRHPAAQALTEGLMKHGRRLKGHSSSSALKPSDLEGRERLGKSDRKKIKDSRESEKEELSKDSKDTSRESKEEKPKEKVEATKVDLKVVVPTNTALDKDAPPSYRALSHRTSSQFLQPTPRTGKKEKKKDKKSRSSLTEEDSDVQSELNAFMTINDLDRMTVKARGMKRSKFKLLEDQDDTNSVISGTSRNFSSSCLKLLGHSLSILEKFESTLGPVPDDGKKKVFHHFFDAIVSELTSTINILLPLVFDETSPLFKTLEKYIPGKKEEPKVLPLDEKWLKKGNYSFYIQSTLTSSLQMRINSMYFTASQIVTYLSELSMVLEKEKNGKEIKEEVMLLQSSMHFLSLVQSFIELGHRTADDIETLFYLRAYVPKEPVPETYTVSVWECEAPSLENMYEPALLPELVARWTPAAVAPPLEFQKVVLLLWPMFATPEGLLHYLTERWNCPPDLPLAQTMVVRGRVLKALEQWIATSPCYISDQDKMVIRQFLEEASQNCNAILRKSIIAVHEALENSHNPFAIKSISRSLMNREQIPAWAGTVLPHSLVMYFDEKVIADQLTLIEFDIYKNIKPRELLGQAWIKEEHKCVARNVVDLIQRADHVSHWVASCILFQSRLQNRITVINKFINIAQHLRELNNYNTVMGIIAGLNIGPVSRLKHSFAGIKKLNEKTLNDLQSVMDHSGAYKKYRETLEAAGPSVVPYIGVPLADLTHIDENEDFVQPKDRKPAPSGYQYINFTKQLLTFTAIEKFMKYQSTADFCSIARAEPVFTFLYSLPKLDTDLMYSLSNEVEPRGADIKNIL